MVVITESWSENADLIYLFLLRKKIGREKDFLLYAFEKDENKLNKLFKQMINDGLLLLLVRANLKLVCYD